MAVQNQVQDTLENSASFSNFAEYAWRIRVVTMDLLRSYLRTRENYEANTHSCPFYSLPVELIEHIRSYLDYVDRSCFALSTPTHIDALRPACLALGSQNRSNRDISNRLQRDHFYNSRTHWLSRQRDRLWCVGCACSHSRNEYPEYTTSLPPHLRNCYKVLNGPVMMCPHNYLKYEDLIRMKDLAKAHRETIQQGFCTYECVRCSRIIKRNYVLLGRILAHPTLPRPYYALNAYIPTRPLYFLPPTMFIKRSTKNVTLRSTSYLMALDTREPLTADTLRSVLPKARLEICPHMATFDLPTIERLVAEWDGGSIMARVWAQAGIDCEVCRTRVTVSRNYLPDIVVLEVVRRLGDLKWAGDPVYRRHCRLRADVYQPGALTQN